MAAPRGNSMPLLPYLEYAIDEEGFWDIEEASAPGRADLFKHLVLDKLPRAEGIMWLRFTLAPAVSAKPPAYLLDMGASVPGVPTLYVSQRNELSGAMEWNESVPAQRNLLLLPEQGADPIICYIRLDGFPGPWFAPMIRSPQNAAGNWGSLSRAGAQLALGVVMLVCLLRGLGEAGQWRVWTACYVGVALLQMCLGMPVFDRGFNPASLVATLAPGIALMLLPHVGRHLMFAPQKSRMLDLQLALLSLPGAALALLPLLPGFQWLDRWLDLWPCGAAIFIPTAIGAWVMGLGGSRRFLLGVIIPPLVAAFAFFGLDFGMPANILASLPAWGVALSALILAVTKAPQESANAQNKPEQTIVSPPMKPGALDAIINLGHPLDDPNLRLLPTDSAPDGIPQNSEPQDDGTTLAAPDGPGFSEKRELALRGAVDELLREGAALGNCSLPAAARECAEHIIVSGEKMAEILSLPSAQPDPAPSFNNTLGNFNLQRILREAHDSAAPAAERAGLALSWHMPPHMDQDYQGDASGLSEVLAILLESAVRGTEHGSIHLSARRVPDSANPGHVLFTITDSGSGSPPLKRSSVALAKAWEFSAKYGGYLNMETGEHGSTIAFSVRFAAVMDEASKEEAGPHVVLACDEERESVELARIMREAGCRVNEARTMREVLVCQRLTPASLLIACGRFARPAAADMVHEFADLARAAGFSSWHILAITADDSEWPLLKPSGFTHAMIAPVDPEAFSSTIRELARQGNRKRDGGQADSGPALIDLMDEFYQSTEGLGSTDKIGAEDGEDILSNGHHGNNQQPFEGPDWLYDEKPEQGPEASAQPFSGSGETDALPENAADNKKEGQPIISDSEPKPAEIHADTTESKADPGFKPEEAVKAAPENVPQAPGPSTPRQDPIIAALVRNLDTAMAAAIKAAEAGDLPQVAEAAGRIAQQAESFHLRVLTRIAQTVERAASAPDLEAVRDILPELANAVERNAITLTQKSVYKTPDAP